jgi:hypothetical protein
MRTRLAITMLSALAAAATLAGPSSVSAGGWAVTSLDTFAMPEPGEPVDITFTILQHGIQPVDVAGAAIVIDDGDGAPERFAAKSTGVDGRYISTVTFPESGRYDWSVDQGWFGPQSLGVIDVGDPAGLPSSAPRWPLAVRLLLPAVAGALAVLAVLELIRPARRRPVPAEDLCG